MSEQTLQHIQSLLQQIAQQQGVLIEQLRDVPNKTIALINASKVARTPKRAVDANGVPTTKPRAQIVYWVSDEASKRGEQFLRDKFGGPLVDSYKAKPELLNVGVDKLGAAIWKHVASFAKLKDADVQANEAKQPGFRQVQQVLAQIHQNVKKEFDEYKKQNAQHTTPDFKALSSLMGSLQISNIPPVVPGFGQQPPNLQSFAHPQQQQQQPPSFAPVAQLPSFQLPSYQQPQQQMQFQQPPAQFQMPPLPQQQQQQSFTPMMNT